MWQCIVIIWLDIYILISHQIIHWYTVTPTKINGWIFLYSCLLRCFNHNYYASNHQIAEEYFPIFIRRFIQMAKVTVRRPKLLMNKMSPLKKSPSQNWLFPGIELGTLAWQTDADQTELTWHTGRCACTLSNILWIYYQCFFSKVNLFCLISGLYLGM